VNAKENLHSIYAMVAAVAMFACMDTTMKLLAAHYPAMQVTVLRCLTSMPIVCAFMAYRGSFKGVFRVRWPLHLLRGVIGIAMLSFFAFALKSLPLAETYSIFFIAPALITALSVFILRWCCARKERTLFPWRGWRCWHRRPAMRCRRLPAVSWRVPMRRSTSCSGCWP
jgi:drug/metabolite transporter (DMT)-like permease